MLGWDETAGALEAILRRSDLTEAERTALAEAVRILRGGDTRSPKPAAERAKPVPRQQKPEDRKIERATLWTDGASKNNPGPAGIGARLEGPDGRILGEVSEYIGVETNNVAEYRALVAGLEKALDLGIGAIEIRADSELMIRQIRGEYRVKNAGLKPLCARVRSLLGRFRSWQASHVPRSQNSEADRLANEAIERHFAALR